MNAHSYSIHILTDMAKVLKMLFHINENQYQNQHTVIHYYS